MKKVIFGVAFIFGTFLLQAQFYKQEQFKGEISEIIQSKTYHIDESFTIDDGGVENSIETKEKKEYVEVFYKFMNKKLVYEINSHNDSIVYSYKKDKLTSFKIYKDKNKLESYKLQYNNDNLNIYFQNNLVAEKIYDKNNNIVKVTFHNSKHTTTTASYYYNEKKQLSTIEYVNHVVNVDTPFHQVQNIITLKYDSNGLLVKEIESNGAETIYNKYDKFGNWVEKIKNNKEEYATTKKIITKRKITYLKN